MNQLVPNCNDVGSIVAGYFFGLDLLPTLPNSNGGEIFYGLVPDPDNASCTISRDFAVETLPGVFVHEFAHMIGFNQRRAGARASDVEQTWLDEGLAHIAEELAGRLVPDAECQPLYDSCDSQFLSSNIANAYLYLEDPEASFLIEPDTSGGDLSERRRQLAVRALAGRPLRRDPADRESRSPAGWSRPRSVGSANVEHVTGEPFDDLVARWQLANYVEDLPGLTPADETLQYTSWAFRDVYQANFEDGVFLKPYPLTPDSTMTGTYTHTGTLRGGSGRHVRIIQPASAGPVLLRLTRSRRLDAARRRCRAANRADPHPVKRMVFLSSSPTLFAGYGTAYLASEDVRYLTRAGIEETRILEGRTADRPIWSRTTPPTRSCGDRSTSSSQSRDYAARLGLNAKETYTTYSDVGRDTLLLVLQAAPKDCICPYTWKYPIVGRIPYKGFFDLGAGKRAADRLAAQGYDVYLRPSGAFSTLGWFNDPLLSTALTRDSVELAALVFHEIAHNTLYVKSATPFNESFAQFVGYRSAESFFTEQGDTRQRAPGGGPPARRDGAGRVLRVPDRSAQPALRHEARLGDAGERASAKPAPGPASSSPDPWAPRLRTFRLGNIPERPVNNARLIGARIYRTRLDLFDRWFERHDRDVRTSVSALGALMEGVEGDSAYARLERAVVDSASLPTTDAPATEQ